MIDSIEIRDTPSFVEGPHLIFGLRPINFFFGANGTGKTTISSGIAAGSTPNFKIAWKGEKALDCLVYNRDFVDANFSAVDEFEGIFTLGAEEINLASEIEEQQKECDKLNDSIARLQIQIDGNPEDPSVEGQKQKQEKLDEKLKVDCWAFKVRHKKKVKLALTGLLKSKEKFRDRALKEAAGNQCKEVKAETLEDRVGVVFGHEQETLAEIPRPGFDKLLTHEKADILAKKVVGKKDVNVAELINKLSNSDWVRQGIGFLDQSPDTCPFCQQTTQKSLKKDLEAYFDETFINDSRAIEALKMSYESDAAAFQQALAAVAEVESKHLDADAFRNECQVIGLLIKSNIEMLQTKQDESSRVIKLDSVKDASDAILVRISDANVEIKEHNQLIANRATIQKSLEEEVWRFILDDGLAKVVADYQKETAKIESIKKTLTDKLKEKNRLLKNAVGGLNELEKKTSSVEPTVKEINKLLSAFGFRGFMLQIAGTGSTYKLVRASGEAAKHTLSEGEKTFVTFLYFYHLIKGSRDGRNMSSKRVVVIDDPVSSLDSDILQIVSGLIRSLFPDVCEGNGAVVQLLILTHNISFHKEVTYNRKQQKGVSPKAIAHWKIFKSDNKSTVLFFRSNPVKSSYEMLWASISRKTYDCLTVHNTLRRLLEQASRLLGGIDLKKLDSKFSGAELTTYNVLMSWAHEGSHFCHEDIFMTVDQSNVEIYLNVFKLIFEKCGWLSHYNLMIEDDGKGADAEEIEEKELEEAK